MSGRGASDCVVRATPVGREEAWLDDMREMMTRQEFLMIVEDFVHKGVL